VEVLVLLDLTRLFLTARLKKIDIDYRRLVTELKQLSEWTKPSRETRVSVVGFTTVFQDNAYQAVFLEELTSLGITIRPFSPATGKNNYLSEMLAYSDADGCDAVLLVTNAEDAITAKAQYVGSDKIVGVAYFFDDVPVSWPGADSSENLFDLCADGALGRILADPAAQLARREVAQMRLRLDA
jgi:hypothetical protein